MPVNPAYSPVLGALYGTDAMRVAFGEDAYLQKMLDVEAALARAQARLGIIPADAATTITRVARAEALDRAAMATATRNWLGKTPGAGPIGAPPRKTSWIVRWCCKSAMAWR